MKKIPIKVISTQEQDTLQVRFFPTDICNFNCSYCFPGSHDGRFRYPKNIDTVIKNFRTLFDFYTHTLGKTKFSLQVAGGGEPTMWPHIEQFCKEIKEQHDVYTTIVSNGSRTVRWWEENSAYFDAVTLSCHHEYTDVKHFIEVADLLSSKDIKVVGLVLMDAQNWDKCQNNVDQMKASKNKWFIQTKEIVDAPGKDVNSYTADQIEYVSSSIKRMPDSEWLLKHYNEMRAYESVVLFDNDATILAQAHTILVNQWNDFNGWKCNVAFETLVINPDGSTKGSCQEPVFGDRVPNIFSETFEQDFNSNFEFKSIICPHKTCSCQPETHVTKSKF